MQFFGIKITSKYHLAGMISLFHLSKFYYTFFLQPCFKTTADSLTLSTSIVAIYQHRREICAARVFSSQRTLKMCVANRTLM